MEPTRKALVVGAGIGGLGAAIALSQRGIECEVVEIRDRPNVFGVGINQPGNSMRALQALGVAQEVMDVGFQFDRWDFCDAEGNVLARCPSNLASDGLPHNNGLSRPDLHKILIAACDRVGAQIHYGTTVGELDNAPEGAHVTLTDGVEQTYDLVVGCDGVKSMTRERILGDDGKPRFTGAGVWRVTVPRPAEVDAACLYQAIRAKAGYIPLNAETMYLLLVLPEPQGVRYEKRDMPRMLRERLAPFGGIVGDIRDALTDDDDVIYGPLHEVRLSSPWFVNRVVLMGDAAHACTPHLTQGAAMALEDAVVLAEEVAHPERPLPEALAAFTERRRPRTKFVQDASRRILDEEAAIVDEASMAAAFAQYPVALPAAMAAIDEVLRQAP